MRHFVVVCSVCLAFLLPGTAFADNVPTAFELCKRMYDNRIAIDAIKLKATSQKRVFTSDPSREKEVVVYELQYSHGRFRCDKTNSYLNSPKKKLEQYLHTSDCHFFRYPLNHTGRNNGDSSTLATIDTNNIKPCYDPRQMGLLMTSVDALPTIIFDFESVTKLLYPSIVSDFHVVRDEIGGENVWKVTYRADKTDYNCSYWIDDKKGCNLVRFTSTAPSCHLEYVVTLQEFATSSGQVWFPNKTILKCKYGADMLEEEVAISPISFDTTDESFTLKELRWA